MAQTYDRYSKFRVNGKIEIVPSVKIPICSSDFYEVYVKNQSRLDRISFDYYGDANYDWLIMMANPEYGSMEFNIPNGTQLRIPYPLSEAISGYMRAVDNYKKLYK